MQGVTCMRIVGSLSAGNAASASVSSNGEIFWGIAWVPDIVASAADGDTQIPDPANLGARDVPWIQRGCLRGTSVASTLTRFSAQGQAEGWTKLDITQMRKQPAVGYELVLIVNNGFSATEDAILSHDLAVMLALA